MASGRVAVPYPAGASYDVVTRVPGEDPADRLRQPIIVENRPGTGDARERTAFLKRETEQNRSTAQAAGVTAEQ